MDQPWYNVGGDYTRVWLLGGAITERCLGGWLLRSWWVRIRCFPEFQIDSPAKVGQFLTIGFLEAPHSSLKAWEIRLGFIFKSHQYIFIRYWLRVVVLHNWKKQHQCKWGHLRWPYLRHSQCCTKCCQAGYTGCLREDKQKTGWSDV